LEREDAPVLAPWINDPEVTRTLAAWRPYTVGMEIEFIEHATKSEQDLVLGIALRADDRLIGITGLHRIDSRSRQASFGISIGEKREWGQGYGTEATRMMVRLAFDTLNLNRVWLHVHETNARGLGAYERAGFRREGVLRQSAYREGRYLDTFVMAVLREEWNEAG
jgi:RimJ/RimL family protein N-acetyltransferase